MAIVLADRKQIVIPYPSDENYQTLDKVFVTKTLTLSNGDRLLVLPHTHDTMRILTNMDINVTGCDMFDVYHAPPSNVAHPEYQMFWYQYETAKFLYNNPFAFCTSTPRTGKTLATTTAADAVLKECGGSALIVAPLTVANGGEWHKTIRDWFSHRTAQLVHKDRSAELSKFSDFYIINPEGLVICKDQLIIMARAGYISVVIFDELTEYANSRSERSKAAQAVAKHIPYRWGLTGTPGEPDKIYGQVKLINPNNVPTYYTRWRDMTMWQVTQFRWKPKDGYEEVVKKAMSPCIRFDKDQVLSIPKPEVQDIYVPLSPQQEHLSKELVEQMRVAVADEEVSVTTSATLALKLLQVAGGAVISEGSTVRIDASPKLEKLKELLLSTPRKKVIFGSFVGINDMLVDFVQSLGLSCAKIDGTVTGNSRKNLLNDFMEAADPHVLVCHPRTTAYGVELASADMIICYGTPMSGAFMYQQMVERLSSTKQTAEKTYVVHLAAGRQDKVSFAALSRGVDVERNIVNLFTKNLDEW